MAKGLYHYLKQNRENLSDEHLKTEMVKWRAAEAVSKIEKPSKIDKARMLGYKAKVGFVILRVRLKRGGRKRERMGVKGRKSRKQTNRKTLKMNYRWVAEIRAARSYPTLEVLNSYSIGKDGKYYFFEVIMVDPTKPEIKSDRTIGWISRGSNKKRAERGLTSAAKKSRGMRSKSPNLKVRPSLRAWNRQGK